MLTFIESLLAGLVSALLEILFKGVVYCPSYLVSGAVTKRIESSRDKSDIISDEGKRNMTGGLGLWPILWGVLFLALPLPQHD